ncbi:MAG: hypothetical protein EZS28_040223, partial [Streblomastix strix]
DSELVRRITNEKMTRALSRLRACLPPNLFIELARNMSDERKQALKKHFQ